MKKITLFFLLLNSLASFARPGRDSTHLLLVKARQMANVKDKSYQPTKSFQIYSELASKGSAEAMNGLGMLYSKGIGVSLNNQQALNWFEKAAKNGHTRAYYNLAMLYKTGIGATLDLEKSYQYFKQGADLNDPFCIYGQGYMLYKGLGCPQNYQQAFKLFAKGSVIREPASMYMLGLCYRNGYGTQVNIDSARFWLTFSSKRGYGKATEELSTPSPENLNIQDIPNLLPPPLENSQPINLKTGFKTIKHHMVESDIKGKYSGYIIKFDWSGKHIISEAPLNLELSSKNKVISGVWSENGLTTNITGDLSDSIIVFKNSAFIKNDHYNQKSPNQLQFKNAKFNLAKAHDTVFISGSVQFYSAKYKEPEKPSFIMLVSTGNANVDNAILTKNETKIDSLHFLAYPNPFVNQLRLSYILKDASVVSVVVSNLQTAAIVYHSENKELSAGEHRSTISLNGPPGTYVITLRYGNKLKSVIVFKN
jgi:hypothetical protein